MTRVSTYDGKDVVMIGGNMTLGRAFAQLLEDDAEGRAAISPTSHRARSPSGSPTTSC